MNVRLLRIVALVVAGLVLLEVGWAWTRAATQGSDGFFAAPDGGPGLVVYQSSEAGLLQYSSLHQGDRIVRVDGVSADDPAFADTFWRVRRPGEQIELGVVRAGAAGPGAAPETVRFPMYALTSEPDAVVLPATQALLSLSELGLAVFVILVRPREPAALPLLVFGTGLSLGVSSVLILGTPTPAWRLAYLGGQVVSTIGFAGLVHLCYLLVEDPRTRANAERRRRSLTIGLLYAVPLAVLLIARAVPQPVQDFDVIVYAAELGASAFILIRGYRHPPSLLTRAQIKWIGLAILIMTMSAVLYTAVSVASAGAVPVVVNVAANGVSIALPIAIGLSVLRYRLFDVDRVVRATVTYSLLTVLLGSGYLALALILSRVAVAVVGGTAAETSVSVVAALAMAAVAQPVQRRVQAALDALVYRERVASRRFLEEAVDVLGRAQPLDVVQAFLTTHAVDRLGLTGAWLVVSPDVPMPETDPQTGPVSPLMDFVRDVETPLVLADQPLTASGVSVAENGPADPRVADWYARGARLLVPLRTDPGDPRLGASHQGRRLVGVWVLGGLRSRDLPGRDEIGAAGLVGRRAALLLDYARLTREQIEQELLQFEVHQAKEVQDLLLGALPRNPDGRLEIACRYQPALEMSGDFFDVAWLPISHTDEPTPGSLQIAVGDVMGKGIGAAIVMALTRSTLRAVADLSMRSLQPAPIGHLGGPADGPGLSTTTTLEASVSGPSPAETLRRTSGLLHHDVGRRVFVACALAVIEPAGEAWRLRLANAAQVPPLLYRDGHAVELVPPGERLPLGILAEPAYTDLGVDLGTEDVVVFVSDGLPEAPSATGEMLGFERLAAIVEHQAREAGGAEDIAAGIWSDVITWCGTEPHHDDMALVVLRVP